MISLRHCGIYVNDIMLEEEFYEKTFDMKYICRQEKREGVFDFLFGVQDTIVITSKLITEKGVKCGSGDMIELIQVMSPSMNRGIQTRRELYDVGSMHIALECVFDNVIPKVTRNGGFLKNGPVEMWNGNMMCIIQDPEKNYIELLQRKNMGG